MPDSEPHDHDGGLSHDLPALLSRRRLLAALGGAGALMVAGCDGPSTPAALANPANSASPAASASTAASAGPAAAAAGGRIPEETAGPFPGDGSNGVNVLGDSGIVRGDITRSFGGASGVARGVPLTIRLTVTDTRNA